LPEENVKRQLKKLEGQLGGTFESPEHYSPEHGFHTDVEVRDPVTGKVKTVKHKPLEEQMY
jgi:hypothetical protein